MSKALNLPTESCWFERYGYYNHYGYGLMLVHWSGYDLQYVLFTSPDSPKKEVISRELLEKYKKEMISNTEE